MRYLAVDPGGKRVGLAVGDDLAGIVTPVAVVPGQPRDRLVQTIAEALHRHRASRVVIGLPTTIDGAETAGCVRSHALAEALGGIGIDVVLQPEHLTTHEARRRAKMAGRSRDQPVDDLAAMVILEEFLAGQTPARGSDP